MMDRFERTVEVMGRKCAVVGEYDLALDATVFVGRTWFGGGAKMMAGGDVFREFGAKLVEDAVLGEFKRWADEWTGLGNYLVSVLDTGEVDA